MWIYKQYFTFLNTGTHALLSACDIDIAILSVHDDPVLVVKGITYCHTKIIFIRLVVT